MKDQKYIKRIIIYGNKISEYLKNVETFTDFNSNNEKVDAVLFNLEQIGETTRKLSLEFKKIHHEIAWYKITGLRNIISHDYEGVNIEIVYDIAINNIPKLVIDLQVLVKK